MSLPWYDVLYKLVTGEIEAIKALNHARSVSRLDITVAEDTATSSKLNQISTNVPCPENTSTSMNVRKLRPYFYLMQYLRFCVHLKLMISFLYIRSSQILSLKEMWISGILEEKMFV